MKKRVLDSYIVSDCDNFHVTLRSAVFVVVAKNIPIFRDVHHTVWYL
jgi:hypothetical protein